MRAALKTRRAGEAMFFVETEVDPEKNKIIRLARKFFPIAPHFEDRG